MGLQGLFRVHFGSVSGLFRVRLGVLGRVRVGSLRGGSVRENKITILSLERDPCLSEVVMEFPAVLRDGTLSGVTQDRGVIPEEHSAVDHRIGCSTIGGSKPDEPQKPTLKLKMLRTNCGYRSIQIDYRQTFFLVVINFQLKIQNRAARRIKIHYRDRSLGISAGNLSLQIQTLA